MEISEAFAAAYRQETRPKDRSACPTAEELTALAAGELPDGQRQALADHLVACSDCALEVRLAREAGEYFLGAEAPASEPAGAPAVAVDLPSWRRPRRLTAAFAVAASLVLAIGLAWQLRTTAPDPNGVVRSVPVAGELVPAENAVLDVVPALLAWPAEAGAEAYRAELLDAAARTVWTSEWSESPSVELPQEVVASLGTGGYLWRVEVRGSVARSELGPYVFTLR